MELKVLVIKWIKFGSRLGYYVKTNPHTWMYNSRNVWNALCTFLWFGCCILTEYIVFLAFKCSLNSCYLESVNQLTQANVILLLLYSQQQKRHNNRAVSKFLFSSCIVFFHPNLLWGMNSCIRINGARHCWDTLATSLSKSFHWVLDNLT